LFEGELLTTTEAAQYLRIPIGTLQDWRSRRARRGPRFVKVHRHRVVYRLADLFDFLESRVVEPLQQG
jgi:hypothetical protein